MKVAKAVAIWLSELTFLAMFVAAILLIVHQARIGVHPSPRLQDKGQSSVDASTDLTESEYAHLIRQGTPSEVDEGQ